jgi:hypothetical protein
MRRLAFLALAGLAACGDSTSTITVGFAQPSAVAAFRGFTPDQPGLRPYLAVANAARADLTLIDAEDDSPVLAPVIVRSLAVPVPDPRPTLLAASPLFDGTGAEAKADLLVVASSGTAALHLVETWVASAQVVDEADLGALAPGAVILALGAVPVPDGATPPGNTAGRVRVVAALSGARLAVVEYARASDGVGIVRGEMSLISLAALAGAPFDAVSLAVNPHDPLHLYAASPDPIAGVEGVAELTMAGAPAAWTVRAIPARAPTRFVAAARLRERLSDWPPQVPNTPYDDRYEIANQIVDRVYAVLDPARCGPNHRIGCGIAVLDPASGLVPDYAGLMPYLAPIALPQLALGLAVAEPPAVLPAGDVALYSPDADDPPGDRGYMKIAPGTGPRATTAVAAIPSGDGRVYIADLSRYGVPNEQSILRTSTRTRVDSGLSLGVGVEGEELTRALGIWDQSSGVEWTLVFDAAGIANGVSVTPGFTVTDSWRVSFQAPLPGLEARRAQSGATADARTWIALQVPASAPGGQITQVARVYDPTFGVRAGDLVEISAPAVAGCPTDGSVEARIAELLPPTDEYPGGALALTPLDDPRPMQNDDGSVGPWRDWPACVAALRAGHSGFQARVLAGGMVAVGTATGYAGRPEVVRSAEVATSSAFALLYEDEDSLEAQCPLLPWPADWKIAPPEFATCDAACRLACERLVLARRSRRIYHVSDQCRLVNPAAPDDDEECRETWGAEGDPRYPFPRANGPVLAFRLGYRGSQAEGDVFPAEDQALWAQLRVMQVTFATRSGLAPTFRIPTTSSSSTASALPFGASTFDRSAIPGKEGEGIRFLVPYANDFVLDFSASEPVNVSKVIR